MSTIEAPIVRQIWERIDGHIPKASAFGGSVPNLATELEHSYHRSWDDSPHDGGYSVHFWGDRRFLPGQGVCKGYAAALDVTLHKPEDMVKYTARLHKLAVQGSPLMWGVREFAGTLDNHNVFAWDCTVHERTYGWDTSHLYHIHLSFDRHLVSNRRLLRVADVFKA